MEEYLQLFVKETSFYNQIVLGSLLPQSLWNPLPHVLQTWLRNYIGGVLLYLLSGGLWALYIYYWKRNLYLPKGILFLLLLWILDLVFPSFLRLDSSVWIWICPIWAAWSCMLRLECRFVDLDGLDLESSRKLGFLSDLIGFSPSIWSKWMKNRWKIFFFFFCFCFWNATSKMCCGLWIVRYGLIRCCDLHSREVMYWCWCVFLGILLCFGWNWFCLDFYSVSICMCLIGLCGFGTCSNLMYGLEFKLCSLMLLDSVLYLFLF